MRTSAQTIRRHLGTIVLVLALAAVAAPAANANHKFVPGVTDNPSRLGVDANEDFVPGVTDVPSRLGVHANDAVASEPVLTSPAPARVIYADRFDWQDAAVGASVAVLAMLLATAAALAVRRHARLEARA
jgi:hypothetical protein